MFLLIENGGGGNLISISIGGINCIEEVISTHNTTQHKNDNG